MMPAKIQFSAMERPAFTTRIFRFGLFEADVTRGTLTRKGVPVKIQDQPFRVLALLLDRSGEIVTRQELRHSLWPDGTHVDFDGSLNVVLKKLRASMEDDSENPLFIETVPRHGYRFIAPVTIVDPDQTSAPAPQSVDQQNSVLNRKELANNAAFAQHAHIRWNKVAGPVGIFLAISLALLASRFQDGRKKVAAMELGSQSSIAVVPFSNGGAGDAFDYLRFAIASDIVTDLTYIRSISVRPFESTTKYAAYPKDPQAVGREMRVSYVVSGDFVNEGGNLKVTTELTRVADDHVLWRDSVWLRQMTWYACTKNLLTACRMGSSSQLAGGR
jgi:DNA-binding winged helix-turn-helix (wHTH) protein/TolB-like protein